MKLIVPLFTRHADRRRWRWVWPVGVLLVLGAAAFLLLRSPVVVVGQVVRRDLHPVVQGVGTVEAKVIVQVAAKITGRIVSIAVDQPDPVEQGQVVIHLDDSQQRAEVRRDEAAVGTADAQLRDLLAGPRRQEIAQARSNVARAEAQLNDLLAGPRQQEIEQLRERVKSASATRTLADRELRRQKELFAKALVAAQDIDRAQQADDVAVAQERDARQAFALGLEGSRKDQIEAARRERDAMRHQLDLLLAGSRPEQIEAARAQSRQARAALALAREQLADTVIRSPLDGYVVARLLEPGATVNPGTPILKVTDPATAWVTLYVDERDSGGMAVGDPAGIRLRSRPERILPGRVVRIEREGDRVTEQLTVDVAFDERPTRVILGEQAEALIRPAAQRNVVAAPLAAVVRRPEGAGVLAVRDGRLAFVTARFGAADTAGWIRVVDGLHGGELVVLSPGRLAGRSNEGRRVRVTRVEDTTVRAAARR